MASQSSAVTEVSLDSPVWCSTSIPETDSPISPLYRHPGNLDESQQKALREMWRRFFELAERNPEVSKDLDKKGGPTKAEGAGKPTAAKSDKEAQKDTPKGDAAKEEAKKQEEMKDMNAFLDKYGGPYLKRAAWEFVKHDHPDASMLRFLRARKVSSDVDGTVQSMVY